MEKADIIRIASSCAKKYQKNLENKTLLFVFGNPLKAQMFEATFLPRNFLHLTGISIKKGKLYGSSDFYKRLLKGQISPDDILITKEGTTEMKLAVLPQLMDIYKTAKMVGNYNFAKTDLYTEKITGTVTACMEFVFDKGYFVPNTALKEDIRDVTSEPHQQILAILRKSKKDKIYSELCYVAKNININQINFPVEIKNKIEQK